MKISGLLLLALLLPETLLTGQKIYKADVSDVMQQPLTGLLRMGNAGPEGKQILINSLYMTIGGKPVLPVMGEVHYSRIRADRWEDVILKTKACGVNIISTYLFWNQHEETEGEFDWEGEKDIRSFIKLCEKHGLYVIVRLGPWAHGEARNGGTPDWILSKKYIKDRSDDPVYQGYVKRYFAQIAKQLEGLCYKDGGNIIGVQLENEYWHAKEGEAHIQWLKDTAKSFGLDVPLYTVTGWSNGSVPPFEVIPLWGAYTDEPWDQTVEKIYRPENYEFALFRNNKNIGNDRPQKSDAYMSYDKYPYLTCEVGIGNQNTYHRRLVISPIDGLGMMMAKLGSGSNMLGYYIFAGATHFRGLLHSTEEEQEETGYWTRVPLKSYDFQAAIRESGEISPAYKEVKKLHYFINEAGSKLAPMMPVVVSSGNDDLHLAVRSDNNSGFLFGINYTRNMPKETRKDCRFQVRFKNETILFPQQGINIPDSSLFIWPLNYDLGGLKLKYSTAQLLGKIDNCYLLFQNGNIPAELAFDPATVEKMTVAEGSMVTKNNMTIVSGLNPGKQCQISAKLKDGRILNLIVLTEREADNCWILDGKDKKVCYISESDMYSDQGNVFIYSGSPMMAGFLLKTGDKVYFDDIRADAKEKKVSIKIEPHPLLADAGWLETAHFDSIPPFQQRYHRFFFKEFNLDNPSPVRKATLYIYPEADCQANLNNSFVRQTIKPGELNIIDLTGYMNKGGNLMYIDFPFTPGLKKFAARIIVEYSNYDRNDFCTDQSWLFKDMYTNPVSFKKEDDLKASLISTPPDNLNKTFRPGFNEWNISIPYGILENDNNVYLNIKYNGDRAELYNGSRLAEDNFNDNKTWSTGLNRLEINPEGKNLRLIIYDLPRSSKIFFDVPPSKDAYQETSIVNSGTRVEYKACLKQSNL